MMLKKILSASLVILQILTQSASAFEFHPVVQPIVIQSIQVQPLQIPPDILKNKMSFSGVNDFLFFKISDSFVNQPLVFDQGLSVFSKVLANQTLSNPAGWRLTDAYRANSPTLITLNGFRGNPSSDSMVLPEIKSQFQVKPDYSSGFMPSAFLGMRYADGISGSSWVLQTTKRFVYDGWNMVEEQTVAGTTKYYVYGLDLSQSLQGAGGVGGLLAKAEGTATHQYFYDANGNVSQMINASSGAVDARYEFDAYGNSILATGTQAAGNTMRFSTKYLDTEFNLYYYGYRYYDPATGRWVNRDPIGEEGFKNIDVVANAVFLAGSLNSYLFANNNAISIYDILGLAANWHHLLPQDPNLVGYFSKAGIDIDSKEFGLIMEADPHTGKGGIHSRGWNDDWKAFFNTNQNANKDQILKQLEKMKKSSKYTDLIKKGIPAQVSYNEWRRLSKIARQEAFEVMIKEASKKGSKKIVKKVALLGLLFLADDINRKGIAGGIANNLLDQVPWIGWAKLSECVTGDWIPDKK